MPIKVTYQNPGLEYDENMVCEDFLNMGMLPLELIFASKGSKPRKYHGFALARSQKHRYLRCFCVPRT